MRRWTSACYPACAEPQIGGTVALNSRDAADVRRRPKAEQRGGGEEATGRVPSTGGTIHPAKRNPASPWDPSPKNCTQIWNQKWSAGGNAEESACVR